jgi:zeta-carotene desaturase
MHICIGTRESLKRLWDPIAYALGFLDCDGTSARCMLTIFQLFGVRSEASVLRMLRGSPDTYLHGPIVNYLRERDVDIQLNKRVLRLLVEEDEQGRARAVRGFTTSSTTPSTSATSSGGAGEEEHLFDVVVGATDVPGIKKLVAGPAFRKFDFFDKIFNLEAVPVVTVQLRFDGWVSELSEGATVGANGARGLDNLLYSCDVDFSCFADLALTSPDEYYKPGEGSLLQCVLTPGGKWMSVSTETIAERTLEQVYKLFPSARGLKCSWFNVVKLGQSLYKEAPGMDQNRPEQPTPVENLFLAGSYTFQDYIDSMEGATKSGLLCAGEILRRTDQLQKHRLAQK